jgi:hypothetical protein
VICTKILISIEFEKRAWESGTFFPSPSYFNPFRRFSLNKESRPQGGALKPKFLDPKARSKNQ